jgi:transposase-like protein
VVNTFLARKDAIVSSKLFTEQLEALSKFSINLTCSYCKTPAVVPIRLDQENRFKCEQCNQVNGVKMQFISTQITVPLEKVMFPVEDKPELKSTLD